MQREAMWRFGHACTRRIFSLLFHVSSFCLRVLRARCSDFDILIIMLRRPKRAQIYANSNRTSILILTTRWTFGDAEGMYIYIFISNPFHLGWQAVMLTSINCYKFVARLLHCHVLSGQMDSEFYLLSRTETWKCSGTITPLFFNIISWIMLFSFRVNDLTNNKAQIRVESKWSRRYQIVTNNSSRKGWTVEPQILLHNSFDKLFVS